MTYSTRGNKAYCLEAVLQDADVATFQILGKSFAKDASAIYVQAKRFPKSNPAAFLVIRDAVYPKLAFACDGLNVYKTNPPGITRLVDAATFHALSHHYGADANAVMSLDTGKILKRARLDAFRALDFEYAISINSVLYMGYGVHHADAKTFRVVGPGVGADKKAVYTGSLDDDRLDPQSIRRVGYLYYASGDQVYYLNHGGIYLGARLIDVADIATFEPLSDDYARDANHAYYKYEVIESAEVASFRVEDGCAMDSAGAFVETKRKSAPQSLSAAPADMSAYSTTAAEALSIMGIVLFEIFDNALSNDDSGHIASVALATNVSIALKKPPFNITVNGIRFTVTVGEHTFDGTITGYLTAFGAAWAVLRGKYRLDLPLIRMVDERGTMMAEGDVVIERASHAAFEPLVTVMEYLFRMGEQEEGEILAYLLDKVARYPQHLPEAPVAKYRAGLEELGLQPDPFKELSGATGTSPQAMAKSVASLNLMSAPKAVTRVRVAEVFHQVVNEIVYGNLVNFAERNVEPFLVMLQDERPLVRDLMWQNLDFLVSRLFYRHAYRTCMPFLERLIAQGINLDINLAPLGMPDVL